MSESTLAVIPIEVAVIIAPTNNAGDIACIEFRFANPNNIVQKNPNRNGNITPPKATKIDGLKAEQNLLLLVSIPTSNSKKTAPNCARKKISFDTGKLFSTLNASFDVKQNK